MTREEMRVDLDFHKSAKKKLQAAYLALADGGVQSYSIGTRSLTKFDLEKISEEIAGHEKKIEALESLLRGGKRRKAVAAVIRDW